MRAKLTDPARQVALGLAIIFLIVLIGGLHFSPDAARFPKIVGAAGLLLALTLLASRDEPISLHDEPMPTAASRRHQAIALLAAPIFAALVYTAGFYPASFLALLTLPYLLGYRRIWVLLAIATGGIIALTAVFSWAMDVDLPNGLLGDWVLNTYVYDH